MPPLLTPHELLLKTPESNSLISVTNLSTTLPLARDAWGRPSKPQPLLITCRLSLSHPFSSSSSSDTITNSTINYGTLSKSLLAACSEFQELCEDEVMPVPMHLRALVCYLQFYLTGCDTLPRIPSHLNTNPNLTPKTKRENKEREPVVHCSMLHSISIEILLPKASLLGEGVSLEGMFIYEDGYHGPSAYSMVLKLRKLRVPTIVGVNENERKGRQVVVCGVEMEKWDRMVDAYNELEEVVVKSIEESSFKTLEALAAHLSNRIINLFLLPHYPHPHTHSPDHPPHPSWNFQRIRIKLSKPTAVTFADAPTVEMLVDSDPGRNREVWGLWKERGERGGLQVPFPLEGRLDEWIREAGGGSI